MHALFVEANHDSVTTEVHNARRKTLAAATIKASHTLVELYGVRATATEVVGAWTAIPGSFGLISGMAHGDSNEFLGQNDLTVFKNGNATLKACSSSVVHLYSCNCGNNLGNQLVNSGAKAFVGYKDFVILPSDTSLNELFIAAAAEIDFAILKGHSAATAKANADSAYRRSRTQLLASSVATPTDVASLDSNHAALVGPWSGSSFGSF